MGLFFSRFCAISFSNHYPVCSPSPCLKPSPSAFYSVRCLLQKIIHEVRGSVSHAQCGVSSPRWPSFLIVQLSLCRFQINQRFFNTSFGCSSLLKSFITVLRSGKTHGARFCTTELSSHRGFLLPTFYHATAKKGTKCRYISWDGSLQTSLAIGNGGPMHEAF